MIRIQLIQPPRNKGYVDNSRSACYVPIGLISIATYLKKQFPEAGIEVLDGELIPLDEIVAKLKPKSVVGIETKMFNYASAVTIAEEAKNRECLVVFGGVYASAIPEIIMRNRSTIIDHIVAGYGELALEKIIKGYLGWKNRPPRIIYHPEPDFNSLPIADRRFVKLVQYIKNFQSKHPSWPYRATNTTTQQGCQYQCLFCSRQTSGLESIYYRDPRIIWQEIMQLYLTYRIDYIVSFDEQITQNLIWLKQLVSTKPKNIDVKWHVFSNAANIHQQSMDLLKALPAQHIFVGIETGSEKLAKTIDKSNNFLPEKVMQAIKLITKTEMTTTPSFVLGLPGETEKTLEETLQLARQIKAMSSFEEIFVACLVPFPGSRAFQQLVQKCPEYADQDELDGEELTQAWFKHFCEVNYETARQYSAKILTLGRYHITLDKGGYEI